MDIVKPVEKKRKTRNCRCCGEEFVYTNNAQINCHSCIDQYGIQRLKSLWTKYGITPIQAEQMYEDQDGKCAICGRGIILFSGQIRAPDNANIDHCHDTGIVRGLLCNGCNTAIGQLGDTPEGVMRAVNYLERTNGQI